ncbi:MAG: hypothetical protein WA858_15425 [Xanthobacteraceae bacterium]|jgi:hypothetical protein
MIRKKPAPDLIRGGNLFSEEIMLRPESWSIDSIALQQSLQIESDCAENFLAERNFPARRP